MADAAAGATQAPPSPPAQPFEFFGKKQREAVFDPLSDNNPITIQILGICSALAVTVRVDKAIVMSIAVIAVLCCSNVIISVLRNWIPNSIRIIIMLAVVASLVIIVDEALKAFLYDLSKELSVFIGLIITNCIIMGRAEAFAMQNKPWDSFLDGLGNGAGYGIILVVVSVFREVLGSGTLLNFSVVPQSLYDLGYQNMGLMVLSPGAFIVLGLLIWAQRAYTGFVED